METLPEVRQTASPPIKPQAEVEFATEAAKVLMIRVFLCLLDTINLEVEGLNLV